LSIRAHPLIPLIIDQQLKQEPGGDKSFILTKFQPIIEITLKLSFARSTSMKKFLSFLVGTTMGALVGATLALLLAPSSGETLRSQIRERFNALQDELSQAAAERRVELENYLETLRNPPSEGIQIDK
jgi:hypothetical protein